MSLKKKTMTAAAALGAVALLAVGATSASAATIPLHIVNGTSSSPAAIYTGGTGSHTVPVSGEDFIYDPAWAGSLFSDAGIYVVFGPELDISDSSVYTDANAFAAYEGGQFWVHNGADTSESDQTELSTAGDFSGVNLIVESTFQDGNDDTFTCTTGPDDTTSGRVDCFIYTLSAHGSWDRGNDNAIPVYFGTE